jgi:hypothetical protein
MIRSVAIAGLACTLAGCANEGLTKPSSLTPMMLGASPAAAASAEPPRAPASQADPMLNLSRKSLAAKVLTSRALEQVTGLSVDPARLSEHD